jgi:transcriptional regulator with XRE-family HTH domain
MAMNIPDILQKKKIEKGMSDLELSKASGLSLDSIYDVEFHQSEFELYGLPRVLKVCEALSVSIADIYRVSTTDMKQKSLAEIIKDRREEKELTVKELAVMMGFDPIVVEVLEGHGDLNLVCMEAFKMLAYSLDLPLVPLLEKLEQDAANYRIPVS